MFRLTISALALLALGACSQKEPADLRFTHNTGAAPVQTASRSEPVFYNGHTYRLDYSFQTASNSFAARVSGMKPTQQAEAVGLTTSAIGHFACPSGHGKLAGTPSYETGVWSVPTACG
jgi:hypothetical protein